jgi:hypothetical protein
MPCVWQVGSKQNQIMIAKGFDMIAYIAIAFA